MVTRKLIHVTSLEAAALAAAATNASTSTTHATTKNNDDNDNKNGGGKKRAVPLPSGGKESKKRQRAADGFVIDLSDVPPQQPILKSKGRTRVQQIDQLPWALSKGPPSKYTGVHFDKVTKKWLARITIEGKLCHIGLYENEEEAAIDYARAVLKYRGHGALGKARRNSSGSDTVIDLSDVPPQPPIPKSKGHIKEGSSKYTGVYLYKASNRWKAAIRIEGKQQCIGYYENEEEAAADYARAVFKYKGQKALDNARERTRKQSGSVIDLSNVPPQQPILKSDVSFEEGASKYSGVYFDKLLSMKCTEEVASSYVGVYYKKQNKKCNKWQAQMGINGKQYYIGCYENEEEAAIDYARAAFKHHGYALSQNTEKQPPTSRNG